MPAIIAKPKTIQVGTVCIDGGNLDAQPVTTLIAALSQLELTGSLTFRRDAAIKEINFRKGLIVGSSSNHIHDSLGRLLLSWGQISQEIHDKLLRKINSSWRIREGERLLSYGVIDAITLNQAIHRQILSRIHDVASWPQGSYIFVPGQVKDQTPPMQVFDALRAAVEGRYGENYLATHAAALFDMKPQRQFTTSFLPLVNRVPELALFLSRVSGTIPFRGLVDFNEASRSWLRILLLRELGCIEFPLAGDIPKPVTPVPIHPEARSADSAHGGEEAPILLLFPPEEEADVSFVLGKRLLAQRRFPEAEKQFLKCVALVPHNVDFTCRLAWSRILQNPLDLELIEANMPMLEEAVRNSPANPDVHFFYAFALHLLGRDAVALCSLERVLAIDPQMSDVKAVAQLLRNAHSTASNKKGRPA